MEIILKELRKPNADLESGMITIEFIYSYEKMLNVCPTS